MDCVAESAYIATVLVVALAFGGLGFFIGRASARADSRPSARGPRPLPPEDSQ